jgi:hypothetical protein
MFALALPLVSLLPAARAADLPPGLTSVPVANVLAAPTDALDGCVAGMAQPDRNITRWVGCGDRTLSVIGSLPQLEIDVVDMLATVPAGLSQTRGGPVQGEPTAMNHAGGTTPALRLTTLDDGVRVELGLAVAWEDGVMRELGICLGADRAWCEAGLRALLTPRRQSSPDDALGGQSMTLLMEPAPAALGGEGRLLRPVSPPAGGPLVGCQRYSGMDNPTVQRLDCTQGRVVVEPMPEGTSAAAARARLLPYLSTADTPLTPAGDEKALRVGDRDLRAAPFVGEGVRGVVVTDPTSDSARALGCLDRAPGLSQTPWCTVALQSMWGPGTADGPRPE